MTCESSGNPAHVWEIGRPVFHFDSVGSTNDVAKRLAAGGAPCGSIVLSNNQTAGKGRIGKQWHSENGGLYFSLLLEPPVENSRMPLVTLLIGASVAKAIEAVTGTTPRLKWPNDILYRGRKLAGILVESRLKQKQASHLIAGIGINVSQEKRDFPEVLREGVTSLKLICGQSVSKDALLKRCLEIIDEDYREMLACGFGHTAETWLNYAQIKNRVVCIHTKNERKTGTLTHLSDDGTVHLMINRRETSIPANQIERILDAACC